MTALLHLMTPISVHPTYLSSPFVMSFPSNEGDFWIRDHSTDTHCGLCFHWLHHSPSMQKISEVAEQEDAYVPIGIAPGYGMLLFIQKPSGERKMH